MLYCAQNWRHKTNRRSYWPVESETELSIGGGCFFRCPVSMTSDPALICLRKCNSFSELFLYDVLLQSRHKRQHFAFFFLRHFELVERSDEVLGGGIPIGFRDAEAGV